MRTAAESRSSWPSPSHAESRVSRSIQDARDHILEASLWLAAEEPRERVARSLLLALEALDQARDDLLKEVSLGRS